MVRIVVFFWVFLLASISFAQDLTWQTKIRSDGTTVIYSSSEGYSSLKEAIGSVPQSSWIKHISASNLLEQPRLQKSVLSYLQTNYPNELEIALSSAGNMHNPSIIQLRDAFKEAILNSEYVKEITSYFVGRCEKIKAVSIEKFVIYKEADKPHFSSFLWLETEQCT